MLMQSRETLGKGVSNLDIDTTVNEAAPNDEQTPFPKNLILAQGRI